MDAREFPESGLDGIVTTPRNGVDMEMTDDRVKQTVNAACRSHAHLDNEVPFIRFPGRIKDCRSTLQINCVDEQYYKVGTTWASQQRYRACKVARLIQ